MTRRLRVQYAGAIYPVMSRGDRREAIFKDDQDRPMAHWKPGELSQRKKSDPVKVALALRLRQEPTLTLKWIAERLHMGSWEYLSRLLYQARRAQNHEVRTDPSPEECAALHEFLRSPTPEERLGLFAPVKDRVMHVLRDQPNLVSPWHRILADLYRDPHQHPTIRDYAVQHLFTLYGYWNERKTIDPVWKAEAQAVFWSALEETQNSIAGTALLGLHQLAADDPEFSRDQIARQSLAIVQAESTCEMSRITALQICARMRVGEALPLARELAARGESIPLRLSAIAALGQLGDASDATWLGQLPDREEPRLQPAINAARQRLTRSNPG